MNRESNVDFFVIQPKHIKVHERLVNWARWCHAGGGGYSCSPMFRLYRAPDEEGRDDLSRTSIPVDSIDGAEIQKGVNHLPEVHRAGINWHYIRPSNPRKAASKLGLTQEGLMLLVTSARTMLVNRGY